MIMSNNIFDKMTILPISVANLNEETLHEDTGIDESIIIKKVSEKIGNKKHNRKMRILKRTLIAAAVCILLISALSLPAVAENIYALYGNIIGGDRYTADFESIENADVVFHDPDLKLDSLSVSGNGNMDDLIDIRLSKKSGGSFTGSEFNIIKSGNLSARFENQDDPDPANKHDIEVIICEPEDNETGKTINGLGCKMLYDLENGGKTLRILLDINAMGYDKNGKDTFGIGLKGRTIKIRSNSYQLATVDNILDNYKYMDEKSIVSASELQNENIPAFPYDIMTNSYFYSDIVYNDKSFDVVRGRIKRINLPFEITFKMNYQPKDNSITVSNEILSEVFSAKVKNGKMAVSPLGLCLTAETASNAAPPDMDKCYITTKDGKKYFLIASGCEYSDGYIIMNCTFSSIPESSGAIYVNKLYLIDPDNIGEIVLNGISVYR